MKVKRILLAVFSKKQYHRGFTLIELLVYIGIFAILITVMTQIFTAIIDSQLESDATSSVAQEGQYLYSRFIYDVHHASAIVSPTPLGSNSASLILTIGGANYTYSVNGTTLQVTSNGTTNNLSAYDTDISNLQFQRIGNVGGKHTVRISFTVASKTLSKGTPEIRNFQTTAGLR